MKGYVFEYFKYVRYTKSSLKELEESMPVQEGKNAILTFGDFDRLMINKITDFSRFRDLSELAREWIGNRQSILLYELDKDASFELDDGGKILAFYNKRKGKNDEHLFWALTEFSFFRDEQSNKMNYEELLEQTKINIENLIIKNDESIEDIEYMIMGTLGVYGIAVLWFSNQFTSILKLVEEIKQHNLETVLSAYTIFSKNPKYNDITNNELIENIKGRALLQLTLKRHSDLRKMDTETLRYESAFKSSGEYDVVMTYAAKDIYTNFENVELFDHQNEKYQKNFLQSKVVLIDCLNDLPYNEGDADGIKCSEEGHDGNKKIENSNDVIAEINDVKEIYSEIRKKIKSKIDKTAGIIDTLDNLLCDYRYNIVSARNEKWAKDFSYIFKRNLECMMTVLEFKNKKELETLEILRMIMNRLKQQIFHIAEANSLNLEIPKAHLRYTGQEDNIVFCYMGIIKEILEVAYELRGINKQSEIVPILTVDAVPIIESELYFDEVPFVNDAEKDQEFKILSINLPHVAFYAIPEYMQYLYHEIYHYIVPMNREERDYKIGTFCVMNYAQKLILMYLTDEFKRREIKLEVDCFIKYIEPIIYQYVVENYQELHYILVNGRQSEIDEVVFVGKKYIRKLLNYLKEKKHASFWIKCFNFIYMNLKEGKVAELTFEDLKKEYLGVNDIELQKIREIFSDEKLEEKLQVSILVYEKGRDEFIDKITEGIKEIYADIAMIEFSNMSLDEYLIFYSNGLKHRFIKPEELSQERNLENNELKELLRVGVVLDYYKKRHKNLKDVKELFVWKYISKYFSFLSEELNNKTNKKRIEERKEEAEKWYNVFEKCQKYETLFVKFSCSQLLDYIDKTSVSKRYEKADINEKSDFYFKTYRLAFETYARELKEIYDNDSLKSDMNKTRIQEIKQKLDEKCFKENIRLLYYFQSQKTLKELEEINKKKNNEKVKNGQNRQAPCGFLPIGKDSEDRRKNKKYRWKIKVASVDEFIKKLQLTTSEIQENNMRVLGKENLAIWYRGQENSIYGLLPSIMRATKAKNRKEFHYLSQYQRYLYEEFKFRADGAPEIMDRSFYNISDYIALMQHYGVATNFMDWSEDAFTALYFAFQKCIIDENYPVKSSAAIMIFSPSLYNEARNYMIQTEATKTDCTETAFRSSVLTAERYDGIVPNIATKYNESIFDVFLLGNIDYETRNVYGNKKEMKLDKGKEIAYLPIALHTSRLNPRLRSQSGIFVAYNLYAEPSLNYDYSYLELEKIQEYYLDKCDRDSRLKYPFLYKIEIDKEYVADFANFLRTIGIIKERIYPELSSIGERIV